eukprot:TRINITY_DN4708_c0_g1_i2.p1 TRINITY_DN4708_c0_g1~~TRINITY_DN4708_c0_g1_i2.p1  ORF type:complete len:192 (-),score=39.89 TRINITY_DN4708_c0_g1_i2:208-783(-)
MGEELSQVDVSPDGTAWGISRAGCALRFRWDVPGWRGHWEAVASSTEDKMVQLAVGSRECVWGINSEGMPFKWEGGLKAWRLCSAPSSGQASSIKCGADGEPWALDADGQVFRWDEDFYWIQVGEVRLSGLAVGNKNRVYGLAKGCVWKYHQEDDKWTQLKSPREFVDIAAGNDGSVWAVDQEQQVWWLYD